MTPLEHCMLTRVQMHEANDCSVLALAMGCRVDYQVAHVALRTAGRRDRQGVWPEHIRKATRTLGHTLGPIIRPKQANGSKYTPKTLAKAYPKGKYLAFSRGHVFALTDGKIYDWHEGRRYHIIKVHQLKEKTT
jgi:hypothetical protein